MKFTKYKFVCQILTLLIVGNKGLCNGLSDGIDLCNMTTTLNLDPDVNSSKSVLQMK